MIKDELIFWGLFLLFNYLQFLPNYLFNLQQTDFLPYLDKLKGKRIGFFTSTNLDFFRYLIDISILILLARFNVFNVSVHLFASYYILIFIFNFYHQLFWTIYEVYPTFYNDKSLVLTGLAILWRESRLKLILSGMGGIVFTIAVYLLFARYMNYVSQSDYNFIDAILSAVLLLIFLIVIIRYYIRHFDRIPYVDRRLRYLIGFLRIYFNIKLSSDLLSYEKKIASLKRKKLRIQPDFSLSKRPNLFFLFVESYGSILMQDEEMLPDFKPMYEKFITDLGDKNWGTISNLSRAPSSSAFSWLCYASLLHGFNISEHAHYEQFLKHPIFYQSDHLFNVMKQKGYKTHFLNPIKPNPKIKIDYTYLTPFYGIDQWILYEHLEYKGKRYGYGDFPPDQYSLNRAKEIIEKDNPNPYVLFFLTKNSHSPFVTPQNVVKDWRNLNDQKSGTDYGGGFLKKPMVKDYLKAIEYQMAVIKDFILNSSHEDDIFFVMGDHQPPVLSSRERNGLNTPIHVIAKNSKFLEGFKEYGFRASLFDSSIHPVKHESMYSVILRELIRNYSSNNQPLPAYEPNGFEI